MPAAECHTSFITSISLRLLGELIFDLASSGRAGPTTLGTAFLDAPR